jgi:hypothetical protein
MSVTKSGMNVLTDKHDEVVVDWALLHVLYFSDFLNKKGQIYASNMSMYEKWKIEA